MDEMKPTQPFVWGANGAAVSPEQIARRRQIAAALIKGGADLSPVGHWTQGLARLAQGGLGGLLAYRADENETKAGTWDAAPTLVSGDASTSESANAAVSDDPLKILGRP